MSIKNISVSWNHFWSAKKAIGQDIISWTSASWDLGGVCDWELGNFTWKELMTIGNDWLADQWRQKAEVEYKESIDSFCLWQTEA